MREDVPVILGAHRHAGSFGCLAGSAFGDSVVDLPLIGRNLLLAPNTLIVMPLVSAPDLHAGVPASFEFFEPVIGLGIIPLEGCGLRLGNACGPLLCHTLF